MFEEEKDILGFESENESIQDKKQNKNDAEIESDIDTENEDSEVNSEKSVEIEDDDIELDEDSAYEEDFGAAAATTNANENLKLGNFIEPEDDDDEEEEDEDYLQHFDDSIRQKIIEDYHPELKTHNFDEVDVLARVVRDNYGNIIDPLHRTIPFITKYEKARILGERASQINAGAKPMVEVDADIIDGYAIALKEYEAKKIPFIIKRPLPNGTVEYWKFEDMEIL